MAWLLFLIVVDSNVYFVAPQGMFTSMEECFTARDRSLVTLPKPKINYELICVSTNKIAET